jgi:quercetin dioxygenase-like cupin family protein
MIKLTTLLTVTTLTFGAAGVAWSGQTPYQGEGHIMLQPSDLQWGPVASMAPGAQIAVIEGHLGAEGEPFTFRLKLPPDYQVAPHVHPEYERVTVLSGTFHFAHGETFDRDKTQALSAGSVAIMPPGAPMFGYTEEETIIQLHGTAPWGIEYLNPEDDPRS